MIDEAREQHGMVGLIQQVAADDQVVTAQQRIGAQPGCVEEIDRRESVQFGILAQEIFGQRMVVASGDGGAAACKHQAGQADAAAEFEDVFAGDRKPAHGLGQSQARGPHHAE